jgi:hypothetical protein
MTLWRASDRRVSVSCAATSVTTKTRALVAHRLVFGAGIQCRLGIALGGALDPPEVVIARVLQDAVVDPEPAA